MPGSLSEKATIYENVEANGVEYGGRRSNILGDVDVLYTSRHSGKPVFTRTFSGHNDLLVTGAVFFTEKANGMRTRFTTMPLDIEYGIHTAEELDRTNTTVPQEVICGFMVGNQGAGATYNTVRPVNRASRSVPGPVPFRVVPIDEDLEGGERDMYFMRVVRNGFAYYYAKKFEVTREFSIQYEDGTTVPVDVDTSSEKFIKVFTRYKAFVDQTDIREYFKITEGSTIKSLINSIGLVSGYPGTGLDGKEEWYNIRGITTMNMENQELKDSESTIDFNYRLHVQ